MDGQDRWPVQKGDGAMAVIEMLLFVMTAGFAVIVIATILVVVGVHRRSGTRR
jgi:hypothetical protein